MKILILIAVVLFLLTGIWGAGFVYLDTHYEESLKQWREFGGVVLAFGAMGLALGWIGFFAAAFGFGLSIQNQKNKPEKNQSSQETQAHK